MPDRLEQLAKLQETLPGGWLARFEGFSRRYYARDEHDTIRVYSEPGAGPEPCLARLEELGLLPTSTGPELPPPYTTARSALDLADLDLEVGGGVISISHASGAPYPYSGRPCDQCGSLRTRQTGTCLTCEECLETSGCS